MAASGLVNVKRSRSRLEVARKNNQGQTHNLIIAAGDALVDETGIVRVFETVWDDGFIGHYVLQIKDDPAGDAIKSALTMVADFGLMIAGGKLIKRANQRLNIGAGETVQSFINFGFTSGVTVPVVSWIYDKFNPPTYIGYANMLTGNLIYPGGAIKI